jgi:hypothetical protein
VACKASGRGTVDRVSGPDLSARDYFRRYTEDAFDLCDVLSSFDARSKVITPETLAAS